MNKQTTIPVMSTRNLAYCALLAALSVVLARLIIPMPNATTRFSIEAVPIVLAGILFGPMPGALVGFCADFVGTLFSGFGFNPLFSLRWCWAPSCGRVPPFPMFTTARAASRPA